HVAYHAYRAGVLLRHVLRALAGLCAHRAGRAALPDAVPTDALSLKRAQQARYSAWTRSVSMELAAHRARGGGCGAADRRRPGAAPLGPAADRGGRARSAALGATAAAGLGARHRRAGGVRIPGSATNSDATSAGRVAVLPVVQAYERSRYGLPEA